MKNRRRRQPRTRTRRADIFKVTANTKELVDTALRADAMEETEEYVARGRRFEHLSPEDLVEHWTTAFKAWCRSPRTYELHREFADAGAELRLRGAEPPLDAVKTEVAALQLEIARDMSDGKTQEAVGVRIEELLLQGRGKATH